MDEQLQDSQALSLQAEKELHDLAEQHHALEGRLSELTTKPYLSAPEQLEEATLKKRKLQLKDRMETLRAAAHH